MCGTGSASVFRFANEITHAKSLESRTTTPKFQDTGKAQYRPGFVFIKSSFALLFGFGHDMSMTRRRPSSKPGSESQPLREWPESVVGGKYVRVLQKHVRALREENPHGNRQLFLDDVFILSLLAFHNPTLRSLRTLEDFSQTRQAQKHLSMTRVCRSTLADFLSLADPSRLQPCLLYTSPSPRD